MSVAHAQKYYDLVSKDTALLSPCPLEPSQQTILSLVSWLTRRRAVWSFLLKKRSSIWMSRALKRRMVSCLTNSSKPLQEAKE